ncbi:MAG: HAMP domain-containing histidine kinase [Calditrichaeota bacterium]|nr:HAMP domain-containing histidine kinase [Calditrichota bacterium]
MTSLFKTFYGKISLIFLGLLFLLGTVQIIISVQSSLNFVCETDQTINRDLAQNLAGEFQPFLQDTIDYAAIENIIHNLMVMNPRVEIYLTDARGNLEVFFADPEKIKLKTINTIPIKAFLQKKDKKAFPIMGDDPKTEDRKKVFSAAEIQLHPGEKGYLYIILGSELYDNAISGVGGSYILSTTAFTFGVILIFGGILGSVLFFNLTKRLRHMTHVVKEFEKGNYEQRIELSSKDEVGQLSNAFNRMAEKINLSMDELRKNDSLRRELIANISHDLRSPLASIQGYIETILMKDESMSPGQRRKFLETVLTSVTNLNLLVMELFELSKLDAMQTKPQPEPFSIAELLQDVVLKFQPQAENKQINLITKIPTKLPMVIGDIGMMDRVLSNLIDNAIRYTELNGKVVISLSENDNKVNVKVSDTGEGIPEEDLPFIFGRLFRVEKSRSKNSGGSGLGLAIVKKIIEAHNSTITVKSELNIGTTFLFTLDKYQISPVKVKV